MAANGTTFHSSRLLTLVTVDQYVIVMEFHAIVWTSLSVIGIGTNLVNIKTFVAMGLTDGVTVSFLALSIFDLTYLMATFMLGVASCFYVAEMKSAPRFPIEPFGISVFFANVMVLTNITNVLTTTYLAIARCMCVAKPLHFRNTFTRRRTIVLMVSFALFAVSIYSPVLANMAMLPKVDRVRNKTRPALWISPRRDEVKDIVWVFTDLLLPFATQVILIICVAVMARRLRVASKFRQASSSQFVEENRMNPEKLSGKEHRVVLQVVLISTVYILCNSPKFLISTAGCVESNFGIGQLYTYLYVSLNGVRFEFEIINSSVNLFIYCKYNSKFRSLCGLPSSA